VSHSYVFSLEGNAFVTFHNVFFSSSVNLVNKTEQQTTSMRTICFMLSYDVETMRLLKFYSLLRILQKLVSESWF